MLGAIDAASEACQHRADAPAEQRSAPRDGRKNKFGPPPPGYWRIIGEPVPDWRAEPPAGPAGQGWELLGPRPITHEYWSGDDRASGRVVDIAPHPTDANVVYIASASGGVWKTVDGGQNWIPISDELASLNHGALALDPSDPNVIFAGTGEYTTNSAGAGLFRSPDGGMTWAQIATTAQVGSRCSGVAVDPSNSNVLHVTGNAGYKRSSDAGASWSTVLSGAASDLAVNPLDPNIVYVARYANGVYRSTNRGQSFAKLTSGLPSAGFQRIVLAIAPSDPNILYAAIVGDNSGLQGLYRTGNGGDSWVQRPNTPNFPYPQGWYDLFLGVDPADPNVVYGGGVFPTYAVAGVVKTLDGGVSWTDITFDQDGKQVHPDQHAVAFGPDGALWIGNDGGVWKSNDGGAHWINCNETLAITQNYNVALHPSDPNRLMTGTQDNGSVGRISGLLEWPQIIGGDGGFLAYDFVDPKRLYTTYVYLTVYRFDPFGADEISGPWDDDLRNFIAPLVMDPSDARTLLGGTNRVWRTHNAHANANWTAISTSEVGGGSALNAIAVAPSDSTVIYTGSNTGRVYVTVDDGATWQNRSSGLPGVDVSDIVIHPTDPGTAYASFVTNSGNRIFRTVNHGVTWTGASGDLPGGVRVTALAVDWRFDPPYLYAGSGAGVWESASGGAAWIKDGADLPNVNIGDLAIDAERLTITAATYGRGAWRKPLAAAPCPGDIDGDGDVDQADLGLLLGDYGCQPGASPCVGDLDGDQDTDQQDLGILLANFGSACR